MRSRSCVVIVVSLLAFLLFNSAAQASVYRVSFDAYTSNLVDPTAQNITFWIELSDSVETRGPDAINWTQPFTITGPAPNLQVFDVSVNTWEEWSSGFGMTLKASDFTEGHIPSGKYTVSFWDKSGHHMTSSRSITIGFLDPAPVTYPTDLSTLTTLTPKITWLSVPGAAFYRLSIKNTTWNEPLYFSPDTQKDVYILTNFTIPAGVLRPGFSYMFRIEARDSDKGLSKRSRTNWIRFTAPAAVTPVSLQDSGSITTEGSIGGN